MAVNMGSAIAYLQLDTTEFDTNLVSSQSKLASVGSKIASGVAVASAAAVAGLATVGKSTVETGMKFDSSMSQVAATMGKTVDQIQDLSDFALEMGANTVFSASEAADALNYMALAGYDSEKSMSMLPNVLNLAAAGSIDLARASDMITDAESALGLSTKDVTKFVDQMAKTASSSNTSVEQLGEAILTVGGTANIMAGGTERLNTVLGILADNGIKGSEAGTHLRNMLLSLSAPSTDGAKAIQELGLEVFDSNGKMKDMQDIVSDLGSSLGELTDEQKINYISRIFNARDIASVNALLNTSIDRWEELGGVIVDSKGAAEEMAKVQLDNLAGDITLFKSAMEGAKITLAHSLTPAIRSFVQQGTKEIGKLNNAFRDNGFKGLASQIGKSLSDTIKKIGTYIPSVIEAGFEFASAFVTSIADAIPDLASQISRAVPKFFDHVGEFFVQELPVVVENIGEGLGTLIADSGGILAAGAKLVGSLVRGALESIPSFIAGLTKGIEDGLVESDANVSDYVLAIREKIDSITESTSSLDSSLAELNAKQMESEHWLSIFDELSGKTNLTASETELLNTAVSHLNELFPGLDLAIDENTGAWSMNTAEIRNSIDALKERAEVEAYTQAASEIYREIAALKLEAQKQRDAADAAKFHKESLEGQNATLRNSIDRLQEMRGNLYDTHGNLTTNTTAVEQFTSAVQELVPDETITSLNDANMWLSVLQQELAKSDEELAKATQAMEDAEAGVKEYDDAIGELEGDIDWLYEQGAQKIEEAANKMKSSYDGAADSARSAGSAAGGAFVDGAVSAIAAGGGKVGSAARGLFANSGLARTKSIASYATGLDYVPRTMNVTVHRGERILTQEENEDYNKGGSIEVTTYQNDQAIGALNDTMSKVLDAVEKISEMKISLDGRKVVGGLISEMDRQLGLRAQMAMG